MILDLHMIKTDFSVMVQNVQPWTLSQFVMWLDLKVAEYKVHGYMILDEKGTAPTLPNQSDFKTQQKHAPRRPLMPVHDDSYSGKDSQDETSREEPRAMCSKSRDAYLSPVLRHRDFTEGSGNCSKGDNHSHSELPERNLLQFLPSDSEEMFDESMDSQTDLILQVDSPDDRYQGQQQTKERRLRRQNVLSTPPISHVKNEGAKHSPCSSSMNTDINVTQSGPGNLTNISVNTSLMPQQPIPTQIFANKNDPPSQCSSDNPVLFDSFASSSGTSSLYALDSSDGVPGSQSTDYGDGSVDALCSEIACNKEHIHRCVWVKSQINDAKTPQTNDPTRESRALSLKVSLPNFDQIVQRMLNEGRAKCVWSKLIDQCACHVLAHLDMRDKSDYRDFCMALYRKYPSIGTDGIYPWSRFSKNLSQKIRHIRWVMKKRLSQPRASQNEGDLDQGT